MFSIEVFSNTKLSGDSLEMSGHWVVSLGVETA